MTTETIQWHRPTDTLPDDDTTVLLIIAGEPDAWIGYLDGNQWRFSDGMPCEDVEGILWWAHMPEGPKQ